MIYCLCQKVKERERSSYPSASAPFISKVIPRPLSLLGSSRSELANMILNRRRSCRKGQKQQAPGTLTGCARSTRPLGRSRSPLCRCSPIFFPTAIGIPAACCTGGRLRVKKRSGRSGGDTGGHVARSLPVLSTFSSHRGGGEGGVLCSTLPDFSPSWLRGRGGLKQVGGRRLSAPSPSVSLCPDGITRRLILC